MPLPTTTSLCLAGRDIFAVTQHSRGRADHRSRNPQGAPDTMSAALPNARRWAKRLKWSHRWLRGTGCKKRAKPGSPELRASPAQIAAIEARVRHLEGDREAVYDAVVRDVPAAFVASLRRVVTDYGAVDSLLDEIARTLPDTARIAGHGAVWHHCAPHKRQIDCEAMVLLERPISAPRNLKFYQLPACRAACVVHPSDEEAFAPACAAAWAAVADQPFELERGPMRERYFSSAGDQRFDLTEIQFPLRPATGASA